VLFDEDELLVSSVGCISCGLWKTCKSPKMEATGKGKKRILIVAEAPGETEDEMGEQLVGESGKLLQKYLASVGVKMNRDCRKINAVNCRPPKNRQPIDKEIECCRGMVWKEIRDFKPRVVLLLGRTAVLSVIGYRWKKDIGALQRWRGLAIPDKLVGGWIFPTFHPSFLLRSGKDEALELVFRTDLLNAVVKSKQRIPKDTGVLPPVKIYRKGARIKLLDKILREKHSPLAFDYECTGLKPYRKGHEIVSVAFSWDGVGHAMLYDEDIMEHLCAIMRSVEIKKIAANAKFEDTWTEVMLKCSVRGWLFDTMIAAHCEDNRSQYTALKFQSYVQYGIPDYDSEVSRFLDSKTGSGFNKIRQCPENKLLKYNGIDSAIEYLLAMQQIKVCV